MFFGLCRATVLGTGNFRALDVVRSTHGLCLKNFQELDLIEPLQRAIAAENYRTPTPIQAQSIPPLLAGRDLLGCAQTGTGKTAAFALPVLQQLEKNRGGRRREIRALTLAPTRELAIQVADSFATYGKNIDVRGVTIYGGVNEKPQIKQLNRGVDYIVATPGRLLDLLGRGFIDLSKVEFFVLDEADRMLDMGFINDIKKVLRELPKKRQNLLLSATIPNSIIKLSKSFLHNPVHVDIAPETPTVDKIDQSVFLVEKKQKKHLMVELAKSQDVQCGIVFTRTKHGANRLTKRLNSAGIEAMAIHGNKSQSARQRALKALKDGTIRLLIGTDVAARGIDVDDVTHVFNFDLPNEPEVYVHRIGRTGRAGRRGIAMAFCDDNEREYLRDIEKLIGQKIEVLDRNQVDEVIEPSHLPSTPASSQPQKSTQTSSSDSDSSTRKRRRRRSRSAASNDSESSEKSENPRRRRRRNKKPPKDGGSDSGSPRRRRRRQD